MKCGKKTLRFSRFGSLDPRWLISCAVIKRMPFKLKVFVLFFEKIAIFIFNQSFIRYPYAYMQIATLTTIDGEVKKQQSNSKTKWWKTVTIEENVWRQIKTATCSPCTRLLYAVHIDTFHSKRWTKRWAGWKRVSEKERGTSENNGRRQRKNCKSIIHRHHILKERQPCTRFKKH